MIEMYTVNAKDILSFLGKKRRPFALSNHMRELANRHGRLRVIVDKYNDERTPHAFLQFATEVLEPLNEENKYLVIKSRYGPINVIVERKFRHGER